MDLYQSPASALDKLVAHNLQPSPEFTAAVRGALGSLDTALRKQRAPGSQRARVIRIAKVRNGLPQDGYLLGLLTDGSDVALASHCVGKLRHQDAK